VVVVVNVITAHRFRRRPRRCVEEVRFLRRRRARLVVVAVRFLRRPRVVVVPVAAAWAGSWAAAAECTACLRRRARRARCLPKRARCRPPLRAAYRRRFPAVVEWAEGCLPCRTTWAGR